MDTGTAMGSPGWRTGPTDLLTELYSRTQLAQSQLGNLFSGQKKYFYKTSEAIINEFDLPSEKADALRCFTETLAGLLDMAHSQTEAKLQKLLFALEVNNVKIEPSPHGKKTIHFRPADEKWHVSAHMRKKSWIYRMPIHKVSKNTEFQDILGLNSEDLYYIQAGWRASDEATSHDKAAMNTTQPWQVLAWVAVRRGTLHVSLGLLHLNALKPPSLEWRLISEWKQQWPTRQGKKTAQEIAKGHPLGLLAWYLGDGKKSKYSLVYAIQNDEESKPKSIVTEILKEAYRTRYGVFLDLIESDKWAALKNLIPRQRPIHVEFVGYTFLLSYNGSAQASIDFKEQQDAQRCMEFLAQHGVTQVKTTISHKKYFRVYVTTKEILKLAENYQEWRRALKQLAEKHGLQPKTPMLRRLLELAENPPLPAKKNLLPNNMINTMRFWGP
jgi:hypothetical protein